MYELKIIKTAINIGLSKPVKFLHITDTHIALDDPERIIGRAESCFEGKEKGRTLEYLKKAIAYAKENNLPIVHTGDLIDLFSKATFKAAEELFPKDLDYIYAAGNHDFCKWVCDNEDYDYKWTNIKTVAPYFKSNLYFDSKLLGEVNIVTLDNSYYLISDGQIECLKAEVAKGYPVILCMHIPLFGPLCKKIVENDLKGIEREKGFETFSKLQVAVPEELLKTYPDFRQTQIRPDEATLRAVEYIKNEPAIKALIVGHNHRNFEEHLDTGLLQIATGGTFEGYVREITVL